MAAEDTYLDLTVGPFALALAARHVVLVRQDVRLAPAFDVRGAQVPLCDLARSFGEPARTELPFVVAVEADRALGAVGVDRVGHLRRRDAPALRRLPAFGLVTPELFEGGVRDGERLLLVIDAAALVRLTHDGARSI